MPTGTYSEQSREHIYAAGVVKLLTAEEDHNWRDSELLRVHAQNTEELFDSTVLSDKIILDPSQRTEERAVDEL